MKFMPKKNCKQNRAKKMEHFTRYQGQTKLKSQSLTKSYALELAGSVIKFR